MSVAAISGVNIASFAPQDVKISNPLQSLKREIIAGNISDAQDALQDFTNQLNSFDIRRADSEEGTTGEYGNSIQTSVQTLRNALYAGDIESAQTAVTQLSQTLKSQPATQEIDFQQHIEQVRAANQVNHQQALQAAVGLESNRHTIDYYA
jgi:hypothetical protein